MNQELLAQPNNAASQATLTALRTLLAATSEVHLYQDGFGIGPDSVLADLEAAEATFTGYAAAVVAAWSSVAQDADGGYTFTATVFFAATDAVTPNSIAGAWLQLAAGTLILWFPFNIPVPVNAAGAYVNISVYVRDPQPSSAVVAN